MWSTIENTPITINLLEEGNSRGWTVDVSDAVHETCNAGYATLKSYPILSGVKYEFSYTLIYVNSGYVQARIGGTLGAMQSTPGFKTETLTATLDGFIEFYSNANARVSPITIRVVDETVPFKPTNTIVWSEKNNNWSDYRYLFPDCGYSIFSNLLTYYQGRLYFHSSEYGRNMFYGTEYPSIFNFVANGEKLVPKTFSGISYNSNELMITTDDGITTSLGQISNLVEQDFLKDLLVDGATEIKIYSVEGIYSAGFMNAIPDVINGDVLKGNYITVELISTETGFLTLSDIIVHSERSGIGSR